MPYLSNKSIGELRTIKSIVLGNGARKKERNQQRRGRGATGSNKATFAVTVDPLPPGSETGTGATYVRTLGTAGDVYVLIRDGGTLKVPEDAEPIEAVSGYKDRTIPANRFVHLDYAGSPPIATLVEEMDYLRTAENYNPAAEIQTFHQKEDVLYAGGGEC